jgi:Uma2 family endonuclease
VQRQLVAQLRENDGIVSAQSVPRLLSVEEYEQIPDPPGGRYELHHGELVFAAFPFKQHKDLQRLRRFPGMTRSAFEK